MYLKFYIKLYKYKENWEEGWLFLSLKSSINVSK